MKTIIIIKILFILLFVNFSALSQPAQNNFHILANELILKIGKEIYLDKRPSDSLIVSQINSLNSFKDFLNNKNVNKNVLLLEELEKSKTKIKSAKDLSDSLNLFWNEVKVSLPDKESKERKNTISKLNAWVIVFIDSIKKKSFIDTYNINKIPQTKSVSNETSEDLINYYIYFNSAILFLLISSIVYLFVKIKYIDDNLREQTRKLRDELVKIKNPNNDNYKEFQDIYKEFQDIYKEDIYKELETLKSIINKITINIRQNNSNEKNTNNEIQKDSHQEIVKAKNKFPRIQYIESPERNGYFQISQLKDNKSQKALYQVLFFDDDYKRIEFDLISNNYDFHRYAMNNAEIMLKPACEFNEIPNPDQSKLIKTSNENGILKKEENKLVIVKKLKIKFE